MCPAVSSFSLLKWITSNFGEVRLEGDAAGYWLILMESGFRFLLRISRDHRDTMSDVHEIFCAIALYEEGKVVFA